MEKFSIGGEVKNGWVIFKAHWRVLLSALAISAVLGIVSGVVTSSFDGAPVNSAISSLLFWVAQMVVSIGMIKIAILLVDKKTTKLSEIYSNYPLFLNYLFMSIILGVIVGVGFILLIIPGIYLAVRLQLTPYFLIDKKVNPFEAISLSWNKSRGNFWSLFLFDLAMGLLNIGGAILLGLGLLVTVPVSMVAMAGVYRKVSA